MINRYSIHTPPYASGRLVEDPSGNILKLDEVRSLFFTLRELMEKTGHQSQYVTDALEILLEDDAS